MQNKAISELIQLVKDNPELEVVPMVDSDIIDDYWGMYKARFTVAEIEEYVISPRDNTVMFKSDDDIFGTLERYFCEADCDGLPGDLDGRRPIYDNLPWKKAIIVYVKPIESEE